MTALPVPELVPPPLVVPVVALPPLTLEQLKADFHTPLEILGIVAHGMSLFGYNLAPVTDIINTALANDEAMGFVLRCVNFLRSRGIDFAHIKSMLEKKI